MPRQTGAVIVMDSAYESFVMDESLPKTIYEVEGARECAVEIRSFSKTAGFTGMRCSYIVIPTDVMIDADDGKKVSLRSMYVKKRGVRSCNPSYVVQMGASGYYTEAGHAQCMENTRYYLNNGKVVRKVLQEAGVPCIGGDNSPYIWMKCPGGMGSWEFLEILLDRYGVVMTPGAGFGPSGEGLCAFPASGMRTRQSAASNMWRLCARKLKASKPKEQQQGGDPCDCRLPKCTAQEMTIFTSTPLHMI